MKTIVLVIAQQVFRDEEYFVPKQIFSEYGFHVITACNSTETAIGKLGAKVQPDVTLSQIDVSQLDALVFVGGGGAKQYFADPTAHALAKEVIIKEKILAAICIAPVILGRAGLLRGKRATVFPDGAPSIRADGAVYTEKPVTVDGNIITANGPEAAADFAETIITHLD